MLRNVRNVPFAYNYNRQLELQNILKFVDIYQLHVVDTQYSFTYLRQFCDRPYL